MSSTSHDKCCIEIKVYWLVRGCTWIIMALLENGLKPEPEGPAAVIAAKDASTKF